MSSSLEQENIQPKREFNSATPILRQKWGRYMRPHATTATFAQTMCNWAQQRAAARDMLQRHAEWLRGFKQQVWKSQIAFD